MAYRDVHFRIDSGYKWGDGWRGCSSSNVEGFHNEIQQVFIDAGWHIEPAKSSSSCPYAVKDKNKLYLHPMDVSGEVEDDVVSEVETILAKGTWFTYTKTDIYGVLSDMTDEEYQEYLESKRDKIENEILWQFRTKRKNLFITDTYAPMNNVRERFRVARLTNHIGRSSSDLEWIYTDKVFKDLVDSGKIECVETKRGNGYRTTVKEIYKSA